MNETSYPAKPSVRSDRLAIWSCVFDCESPLETILIHLALQKSHGVHDL